MKGGELNRTRQVGRTARLSRSPRKPSALRDIGPDVRTRRAVYERDGYLCVCCGRSIIGQIHSVGQRKRWSQGGGHDMPNLLTFIGLGTNPSDPRDHRARIDSRCDPDDEAKGYWVRSYDDPALVPVIVMSGTGASLTLWPTADGRWSTEPPARAAGFLS